MEKIISDRRQSFCCKDGDIFRKYFKYGNKQAAEHEGKYSRLYEKIGINTPHFVRTGFSEKFKLFFNEYCYIDMIELSSAVLDESLFTKLLNLLNLVANSKILLKDGVDFWNQYYRADLISALNWLKNYEQNVSILEEIFSWRSEDCALIINSAGDIWEILERYPIIAKNLEHITVIANGGEVIVKYGRRDILWQEYHHMQPTISEQEIEIVTQEIFRVGLTLIRIRIVDELYVNFKVVGNADKIHQVVRRLNNSLSNATRQVIANAGNIKLISRIINKGSALAYLKNFQLKSQRMIGIGNDVLDEMFLAHCDKAFMVNQIKPAVDSVKIESLGDVKYFLRKLRTKVFTPT